LGDSLYQIVIGIELSIRIGVIGTGYMGKNHVRVFSELTGVKLVAITDIDERIVKLLSEKYGVRGYSDYMTMYETEELDAVSIAVPTSQHMKVVLDSYEYVNNVFVEKPIAANLVESQNIVDEVNKRNTIFMVGHIERFNPAVLKLKELLKNDHLGRVVTLTALRVGPYEDRVRDAGVIVDNAIHDIDVMRFLIEKPVKLVYARMGSRKTRFDDYSTIVLEFEEDIIGNVVANRLTPTKIRTLKVTCEEGFALVDYITQELAIYGPVLDTHYQDYEELISKFGKPEVGKPRVDRQEPLKLELQHFIECVKTESTPIVDACEGHENLEIATKALESAKHDKIFHIPTKKK